VAFNGSGLFNIDSTGQPVSANTLIESADFNALTADLATGLSNCITKDGQQTITANLPMATYRHTGVGNAVARTDYAAAGQVQDGKLNWVDGGGTADAITATYSPAITALVDGQLCCVRATAANATTTPTFAPNGLTARTIVKKGGAALVAGDIVADGHELILRYDLTNTRWELLNPGSYASLGANTFTGLQTWSAGANIASAATVDLTAATGNTVVITGTTTTTALTMNAGQQMVLVASGAWPLTHHATNLNIAGGVDVTCSAGDRVFAFKDGGGVVRVAVDRANGVPIIAGGLGTQTNDSAPAGYLGEYLTASLVTGSATALTTATPKNVISLSLTAGDWDVGGVLGIKGGGTTTITYLIGCLSATSATLDTTLGRMAAVSPRSDMLSVLADTHIALPTARISLASTTTIYLVAQAGFATSTCSAFGAIFARRAR